MNKRPTNDEKEFDEFQNNFQGKSSVKIVRKKPKDEKVEQDQENHKIEQVMTEKIIERNSEVYKEPKEFKVKYVPLKHNIFLGKKKTNVKEVPKDVKIEENIKEPDIKYEQFYSSVAGQRVFEYQQMNEMIKKKQEVKEAEKIILIGMNDSNINVVYAAFECLYSYVKFNSVKGFKNVGLFERFSYIINEDLIPVEDFIFETILIFCNEKEYINDMMNSFKFLEAVNSNEKYKIKIFLKMIQVNPTTIKEIINKTNIDQYCKRLNNLEMYLFLNELIKNGYCLDIINDLFENISKSKNGFIIIQSFIEYHYELYDFKPFIKEIILKLKEYPIEILKLVTSIMKKDKNFKIKIDLKLDNIEYLTCYYEYLIYLNDETLIQNCEKDKLLKSDNKWYYIYYLNLFKKDINKVLYYSIQLLDSKDTYIFYNLSKYLPKTLSDYLIEKETWKQKDWIYSPVEDYYQNHTLIEVSIPLIIDTLKLILEYEENSLDFQIPIWIRFINILKIFLIQDIFLNPEINNLLKKLFKFYENSLKIDNYNLFFTFFETFITNYISNSYLDESWNLYLLPFLQLHFPSKFRLLLFKELKLYVNNLFPSKDNILYYNKKETNNELLSIYSDLIENEENLNENLKYYIKFHLDQ